MKYDRGNTKNPSGQIVVNQLKFDLNSFIKEDYFDILKDHVNLGHSTNNELDLNKSHITESNLTTVISEEKQSNSQINEPKKPGVLDKASIEKRRSKDSFVSMVKDHAISKITGEVAKYVITPKLTDYAVDGIKKNLKEEVIIKVKDLPLIGEALDQTVNQVVHITAESFRLPIQNGIGNKVFSIASHIPATAAVVYDIAKNRDLPALQNGVKHVAEIVGATYARPVNHVISTGIAAGVGILLPTAATPAYYLASAALDCTGTDKFISSTIGRFGSQLGMVVANGMVSGTKTAVQVVANKFNSHIAKKRTEVVTTNIVEKSSVAEINKEDIITSLIPITQEITNVKIETVTQTENLVASQMEKANSSTVNLIRKISINNTKLSCSR